MTVSEIIDSVQFVVDRSGKPTAAMLDINIWADLRMILEELEDKKLIQDRLTTWRTKAGWTRWVDFEAELETNVISDKTNTDMGLSHNSGLRGKNDPFGNATYPSLTS